MITQWSRAHPTCARLGAEVLGSELKKQKQQSTWHKLLAYRQSLQMSFACCMSLQVECVWDPFRVLWLAPALPHVNWISKNISGEKLYCHNGVEIRCCSTYLPRIKSKTMFCVNTAQCYPWHNVGDAGEHPWLASYYLSELYYISGIQTSKFSESSLNLHAA